MKTRTINEMLFRSNVISILICTLISGLMSVFWGSSPDLSLAAIPLAAVLSVAAMYFLSRRIGNKITAPLSELRRSMISLAALTNGPPDYCHEIRLLCDAYRLVQGKLEQQTKKQLQVTIDKDHVIQSLQNELSAFESQINSPFIDETLELIPTLIAAGNSSGAAWAASALNTMIHSSLSYGSPLNTLKEELDQAAAFFQIKQLGRAECNTLEFDCPAPLPDYPVIKLILVPFIENALIHGFRDIAYPGIITLSVKETPEELIIRIADNGTGGDLTELNSLLKLRMADPKPQDNLKYYSVQHVYERLHRSYGRHFTMYYEANDPTGITVCICFELQALRIVRN